MTDTVLSVWALVRRTLGGHVRNRWRLAPVADLLGGGVALRKVNVTLDTAAIRATAATPYVVIPAPGAGLGIEVIKFVHKWKCSEFFDGHETDPFPGTFLGYDPAGDVTPFIEDEAAFIDEDDEFNKSPASWDEMAVADAAVVLSYANRVDPGEPLTGGNAEVQLSIVYAILPMSPS